VEGWGDIDDARQEIVNGAKAYQETK
jgi:hypothetical protein